MNYLAPLPVAIPFAVSALMMAAAPVLSRRVRDTIAIATTAAVAALCALLVARSLDGLGVTWFGGWLPRNGVAVGICFAIDPLGAGLALLISLLVLAAFVFSWRYFDEIGSIYPALMLIFLGAMTGFCLTGDLFNMFVFFELMSVTAYALTGYKIEEERALMGAFNFAITNSVGAFLVLVGIGLLYGRTGAQPGTARPLPGAPLGRRTGPDGVDVDRVRLWYQGGTGAVSFLAGGCPCRGADTSMRTVFRSHGGARSVRRGPGLLDRLRRRHRQPRASGSVRLVGAGPFHGAARSGHVFRRAPFETPAGVFHGQPYGDVPGRSGAADPGRPGGLGPVRHRPRFRQGALFLGSGILLNRFGSVDESELRGRGRKFPGLGILFLVGGLALSGLPPFGTWLGKSLIEESAGQLGHGWLASVLLIASALTGGAVLRAAGQIFLGLGPRQKQDSDTPARENKETEESYNRPPAVMFGPAAVLLALALGAGLWPGLEHQTRQAASRFQDQQAYAAAVLDGSAGQGTSAVEQPEARLPGVLYGLGAALGAIVLALLALFPRWVPRPVREGVELVGGIPLKGLRALHSGQVGDYVTWVVVGTAVMGGLLVLLARS